MWFVKKYNQKKRIKEMIYRDFEKALLEKDYKRTKILSERFLKLYRYDYYGIKIKN